MKKLVNLIEQLGSMAQQAKEKPTVPRQKPTVLSFDFIDDLDLPQAETESPRTKIASGGFLGRTEQCVSTHKLSQKTCLEEGSQSSNITYLQPDARTDKDTIKKVEHLLLKERKRKRRAKFRASALADASDLFCPQAQLKDGVYNKYKIQIGASRQVSLDILRKTHEPTSEEALLDKIKKAYDKVGASTLMNMGPTKPKKNKRTSIRIKIG